MQLGVRPVPARMPYILVMWGPRTLNADEWWLAYTNYTIQIDDMMYETRQHVQLESVFKQLKNCCSWGTFVPQIPRVSVFCKIKIFSFQWFDSDSFMNVSMLSNQVFD